MKKLFLIAVSIFLLFSFSYAQSFSFKDLPLEVSGFNNGNFMPGKGVAGVWSKKFHPGIRLGSRYTYLNNSKHNLFQTLRLGYFYHEHAQKGIQLYTEFGYRFKFSPSWFAEATIGGGYLLSMVDLEQFVFDQGVYQEKGWKGRNQWMAGLAISPGYSFYAQNGFPMDLYLSYHFWVQSPFVNKYVPILPNNSVHLGVIYYFNALKTL